MGCDFSRCVSRHRHVVLLIGQSGRFALYLVRSSNSESASFSPTYDVARQRFLEAARNVRAQTASYPIDQVGPTGESLSVDVAWVGAREPTQAVVVTSGLHGVEGFFGSAVQLAWLSRLASGEVDLLPRTTVVLVLEFRHEHPVFTVEGDGEQVLAGIFALIQQLLTNIVAICEEI